MICWLRVVAAVDLFTRRAVKIPNLQTEASGLHKSVTKCSNADVVDLTLVRLDSAAAICLDITHDEVSEVIGMRLYPGAG